MSRDTTTVPPLRAAAAAAAEGSSVAVPAACNAGLGAGSWPASSSSRNCR